MANGEAWSGYVPLRARPKARPRVTKHGTFMPRDYKEWREDFGALLMMGKRPRYLDQPIELELRFDTDGVAITTTPLIEAIRPKYLRTQDIDNLIGGVMEVLEDVHVVENDRQIYVVHASVLKEHL